VIDGRALRGALSELGIGSDTHLLVHASFKAFGGVYGGPAAVADALVATAGTVMMPASTGDGPRSPAVWDASGDVPGNAYPPPPATPQEPTPFSPDMPIDKEIGVIAETFRRRYPVIRTRHPRQSFVAHGTLAAALTADPVTAPIERLMEAGGSVLLLGVTHTSSTAVHLAERLAGRPLFLRHALTHDGVRAVLCGGCSDAFDDLQPYVEQIERRVHCGAAGLRLYRLTPYVEAARHLIGLNPDALLCRRAECVRCAARRRSITVY
jgi:aminoglycoside 3-N-acetyltransferase